MKSVTTMPVDAEWRGAVGRRIAIPAGTAVERIETNGRQLWAVDEAALRAISGDAFYAAHYYAWVPSHAVTAVVMVGGREHTIDVVANLMDDELREALHSHPWADGEEQAFVDAYMAAHLKRFGVPFVVN